MKLIELSLIFNINIIYINIKKMSKYHEDEQYENYDKENKSY